MSDNLMSGIRTGIMMSAARRDNGANDTIRELNRKLIAAEAAKEGYAALTNAIVSEIKAEAAGDLKERRLSDPGNREARVHYKQDVEDDAMRRLSGGAMSIHKTYPNGPPGKVKDDGSKPRYRK